MSHHLCVGEWGVFASLPTELIVSQAHAFFLKIMSTNITNLGNINYYDHHRDITINTNGTNAADLLRAALAEDVEPEPVAVPPKFFCVSEKFPEQNIRDRLAAELSHSTTKIDYCRALYSLQHIGCINISQFNSDEKRAKVFNEYQSKFILSADDFYRARLNK